MGPLAQLFALLNSRREFGMEQPPPVHRGLLEEESVFAPRQGLPPRSFRDPSQMGPAPPVDRGIISMMQRKGGY